jgi:hypothetical protein
MRESAGASLKSSLSHTLLVDTRDDKMAATRGAYGKIYQELAGLALGGDVSFYKAEAEGQVSRGIGRGVVRPILFCLNFVFSKVHDTVDIRCSALWFAMGARTGED